MKFIKAMVAVCISVGSAFCCLAPANMEGVAFTSEEKINLEKLQSMGTLNEHYFKDSSNTVNAIRYVSHYSNDAMVFIGNYGLSYQENIELNCMGIILDEGKMPENGYISRELFNFAEAVKVELLWLKQHEIIEIPDSFIDSIYETLDSASNGGLQYWTLQKNVLSYNSWYSNTSVDGIWSTNAVRTAKGVYGCSGIQTEFLLPSQQLGATNSKIPTVSKNGLLQTIRIDNNAIRISLSGHLKNTKSISLINASGKLIAKSINPQSSKEINFKISGIRGSGLYFFIVHNGSETRHIPVMIAK